MRSERLAALLAAKTSPAARISLRLRVSKSPEGFGILAALLVSAVDERLGAMVDGYAGNPHHLSSRSIRGCASLSPGVVQPAVRE
jgi:hypothetical protein